MKITYICHSSFFIKQKDACFLFDYWKGELPEPENIPLYIFVSHFHKDHFDPAVFEYGRKWKETRYILADDIKPSRIPGDLSGLVTVAHPDAEYELSCGNSHIAFKTLRSTDSGNAYLVDTGEKTVYHAGDLHLWLWGESAEEDAEMRVRFEEEINKLRGRYIDAAFLPLDPRQEQFAFLGLDHTAHSCDIGKIYPMHFWGDFSIIEKLKADDISIPYRQKVFSIVKEGDTDEI